MKSLTFSIAFALLAVPAAAQTSTASWQPWLGCWELTAEGVRGPGDTLGNGSPARRTERPRVCVTAIEGGGARFATTISGENAVEHSTFPDGTDRPLADGDCRGTQRAEWSRDGLRLFSRAELTCAGDAAPRRLSGMLLFAPNGTWLDVQAVEIGGRESVRVRRYYRADGAPVARATVAAAPLTLDDVKEASGKLPPRAVEAALVETAASFDLSASRVIELDEAGVADSVIDLMVALSYPDRFVVERTPRGSGGGGAFVNDPFMLGWAFGYPVWYDDFFYSPYYYMPFGYSSYALRQYGDPFYPTIFVTDGGGSSEPRPSGTGRVVDGQGYTRVRAREPEPDSRTSASAGSSAAASSTSAGSASGSSATSGGGYSSSGSSDSGGRTAQPR